MHVAAEGQAVAAPQACVQYPPFQTTPPLVLAAGVHRPDAQSTFSEQPAPMGSMLPTQLPLLASQTRLVPQLKPCRQSGRHDLAALEQT